MKIAVPVDENKKEICVSFGRAPYFLLCDPQARTSECLENTAAQAVGGAGVKTAQFVVDSGAEALVTVRCGENAAEVLQAAEIEIYKAQEGDAAANAALCQEGKLAPLTKFHAGFVGNR